MSLEEIIDQLRERGLRLARHWIEFFEFRLRLIEQGGDPKIENERKKVEQALKELPLKDLRVVPIDFKPSIQNF
jgi:hypothetical protein